MFIARALTFIAAVSMLTLAGCASGTYQARLAEREKLSSSSGLYCEFVNGEQHPDVDVELNMQMAKRCDATKNFTITNYKTSSEMNGMVYCCQTAAGRRAAARSAPKATAKPAAEVKAPSQPKTEPAIDSSEEVLAD